MLYLYVSGMKVSLTNVMMRMMTTQSASGAEIPLQQQQQQGWRE